MIHTFSLLLFFLSFSFLVSVNVVSAGLPAIFDGWAANCILWQGGFSSLVKSRRKQCIELISEIEARLDFDDELPPLDSNKLIRQIDDMWHDVQQALDTANYDKLLQSGLQVFVLIF